MRSLARAYAVPAIPATSVSFSLLPGHLLAEHDPDGATVVVERWWRKERKAFQIACALGGGIRLSLDVLGELRLILRLMRRKRMQAEYDVARAALCEAPMRLAAE
jgi:hypothetical protein